VRFDNETLETSGIRLAHAQRVLQAADLVIAASYFDRKFDYHADAADYEFYFNQLARTTTRCNT
jgi:hypothetical protein